MPDAQRATVDLPWRAIVGMRNNIMHGYFELDHDLVWQALQDGVPMVRDALRRHLGCGRSATTVDDLLEEYPRAGHHMDAVDEQIQAFEIKYCTPPGHDDLMAIVAEVHADHEECACSGCCAG